MCRIEKNLRLPSRRRKNHLSRYHSGSSARGCPHGKPALPSAFTGAPVPGYSVHRNRSVVIFVFLPPCLAPSGMSLKHCRETTVHFSAFMAIITLPYLFVNLPSVLPLYSCPHNEKRAGHGILPARFLICSSVDLLTHRSAQTRFSCPCSPDRALWRGNPRSPPAPCLKSSDCMLPDRHPVPPDSFPGPRGQTS